MISETRKRLICVNAKKHQNKTLNLIEAVKEMQSGTVFLASDGNNYKLSSNCLHYYDVDEKKWMKDPDALNGLVDLTFKKVNKIKKIIIPKNQISLGGNMLDGSVDYVFNIKTNIVDLENIKSITVELENDIYDT